MVIIDHQEEVEEEETIEEEVEVALDPEDHSEQQHRLLSATIVTRPAI